MQARATWEEGNKARIEAEKQKQEVKDAKRVKEMNELRNLPASEGGFMFKAREIERGVESSPHKTAPVHSTKPNHLHSLKSQSLQLIRGPGAVKNM